MFSSDFNPELPQRLRAAGDHPPAAARDAVPLLVLWPAHTRLLHPSAHRSGCCPGGPVLLPAGAARISHRELRSVLLPSELHRVNILNLLGGTTTAERISKHPLDSRYLTFLLWIAKSLSFCLWAELGIWKMFRLQTNSNSDPRWTLHMEA